jgi:ribose-phosphate pyrophosphokinase
VSLENTSKKHQLKIIGCNSNPDLVESIARRLNIGVTDSETRKFMDGEIYVKILDSVRSCDVFIVQSTCRPANDHLMELLLMIDAAKRASARTITAVIPYYGYSRQDRKAEPRVPISAKLVANLLQTAGINRILSMDLHADQIQGFFDVPVDNLFISPIAIEYIKSLKIDELLIVSPDTGGTDRARHLGKYLQCNIAIIDKRRPKANVCQVMNVIGEVKDKNCILVDDIIDTAGSISGAAEALKNEGAKDVYCMATHPVLSGSAVEKLKKANFKEIIFSDTIPIEKEKMLENMTILPTSPLFSEAIKRIYLGESVSNLFV